MLAEKLETFVQTNEFRQIRRGLLVFLSRLVMYFQALAEQYTEVQKTLEFTRTFVQSIKDTARDSFETAAIRISEKRLQETREQLDQMEIKYKEETENNSTVSYLFRLQLMTLWVFELYFDRTFNLEI